MSLEDDERVRFYLRHRVQIAEWAALRADAAEAVDEWLLGLEPHVSALAAQLGAGVASSASTAEELPCPSFQLARATWPRTDAGGLVVSVNLEWVRGRTTLLALASPYVGLRSLKESSLGAVLRADEATKSVRTGRKDTPNPWWVGYGYVLPKVPFPDEAEKYRQALIDALRAAWNAYAPVVDQVLQRPAG